MKKKFNIKRAGRSIGRTVRNVGAVAVATVVAVAATESAFVGAEMMQNDASFVANAVKNKLDRSEPVYYKEGLFGKKQVGVIDKKTGDIKPYTGNKVPVSKKAVRV